MWLDEVEAALAQIEQAIERVSVPTKVLRAYQHLSAMVADVRDGDNV